MISEKIIFIGLGMIFIGVIFLITGSIISAIKSESKTDIAFGGFIGPIPFGFFTSKNMFWAFLIIVAIFFIFWILLRKFW